MNHLNQRQAIEQMNALGKRQQPFLFITDFSMQHTWLSALEDAAAHGIWYQFGNVGNTLKRTTPPSPLQLEKQPPPQQRYQKAFELVQYHINQGNTYLLNLTLPSPIRCNWSPEMLFHYSRAKYKLLWHNRFVCFSPEIFVQISNQRIHSFPMKGTIDASLPNAYQQIMSDLKESAEHTTIVDLIRNDLSRVARNVRVERFRYTDTIITHEKQLLQVSSEIAGDLPDNYTDIIGSLIFSLLPAGSITGAPKEKTVEIILQAEQYERGFYTGVAGIFDGKNLDSCVLIRYIDTADGQFTFKSGGGITHFSKLQTEYNELKDKVYVPVA